MRTSAFLLLLLLPAAAWSQPVPPGWETPYEQSGFVRTPRYEETMAYCRKLADASPWIRLMSFGKSPEGRDLPLVIASKEREFDPRKAGRSGKAVLLIQNGIHAGEIDGKDACLMLLRDIAITKTKASLLDHVILLVIPIYNVDGHERFGKYNRINQNGPEEMGWRVTAQNLNLNRDYVKADAPETRAWLNLYTSWLPDFFVDCHVTDGADYQYDVTYTIETHRNVPAPVRTWVISQYLPVLSRLTTNGVPATPYVSFRDDRDPMKGLEGGTMPPRFSTVYTTLQNRPGLLIETHMLKDYRTRVEGTYQMLEATLRALNNDYRSLKEAVRLADEQTAAGVERPFPLQFGTADVPSDTVHFLGYRQRNEPSDISGATRIIYTKEPFEADIPRYDSMTVTKSVEPPEAYLIPRQYSEVISRLKLHGLKIEELAAPETLTVEMYRLTNASWQQTPYEGRHPVRYNAAASTVTRTFPAGTAVVRLHQRAARVALHALEPDGPDSFLAWGFFDAIFEQKEYAEGYVMEPLARSMLAADSALRNEFAARLRTDSAFAKSPGARLNFFYRHSPYWDDQVNLYPVARLMTAAPLKTTPYR